MYPYKLRKGRRLAETELIICGYPRSGSGLFYQMLKYTVKNFQFRKNEGLVGKPHSISKEPNFIHYRPPNAMVCIRDIRAVLTSKHFKFPGQYVMRHDTLLNGWKGIVPTAEAIRECKDPFFIRYEELIDNPDGYRAGLEEKYDMHFNARSMSNFYLNDADNTKYWGDAMNGIRPLDKGHDWRDAEHREHLVEQFTEAPEMLDILVEYGYEKDHSWFDALRS